MMVKHRKAFRTWTRARGNVIGYRLVLLLCRLFGFGAAGMIVATGTLFYALFARDAREGSLDYLRRVGPAGRGPVRDFLLVWKHFRSFGKVILDRLRLYEEGPEAFEIRGRLGEDLIRLRDLGKGCIIAGAHVGAFELASALFEPLGVTMVIVMLNREKETVRKFIEGKRRGKGIRILWVGEEDELGTALAVYRLLRQGCFVAMSVDRYLSDANASEVEFLGSPARFNLGVFMAAGMAGAPIFSSFLIQSGEAYRFLSFPILWVHGRNRREMEEAAKSALCEYVKYLEKVVECRPFQWYNFYLFWKKEQLQPHDGNRARHRGFGRHW